MRRLSAEVEAALEEWLQDRTGPAFESGLPPADELKADAATPPVNLQDVDRATMKFMVRLRKFWQEGPNGQPPAWHSVWETEVDRAEAQLLRKSDKDFKELGISPEIGSTVAAQLAASKEVALRRIIALSETQVNRMGNLLANNTGLGVRELQKKITAEFGGVLGAENAAEGMPTFILNAERHANLLARDQILSAHADLTKTRFRDAGVQQYIWTTAQDDRVRDRHVDLDGEIFDTEGPGAPGALYGDLPGHPGEDYQCRCIAYPVVPELE